jgi:general secretion pathway protein I
MNRQPVDCNSRAAWPAAGFTLIEVLAALVIVALGMLGVIEAVTQSARNGTYLREKTIAHWVAMNVITDQRLQPAPPPIAESSNDVELAGERWHWTMNVSQTQVQSLRRIDVSVRHADAADGTSLASMSGFYGTAISPVASGGLAWNGPQGGAPGDEDQGADGAPDKKDRVQPPVQPPAENPPPAMPPQEEE